MRIEQSKELQRHAKVEAKVIHDRESGRSRGFGFVTYSSLEEVNSAIESLDGAVGGIGHVFCAVDMPSLRCLYFSFFF
ncbi:hypothetical protein AHAS_Ahas13G0159000 [Arachis hypogaea]